MKQISVADVITETRRANTFNLLYPHAYAAYFEHNIRCEAWSPDDEFSLADNGLLMDPTDALLCFFHEPLPYDQLVDNPASYHRGMMIGQDNCPFVAYPDPEDTRVITAPFHYSMRPYMKDYVASLPKKRRDGFKSELKKEGSLNKLGSRASKMHDNALKMLEIKAKAGGYESSFDLFPRVLDCIPDDCKKAVNIFGEGDRLIGGTILVKTAPETWYCLVSNSIERCAYSSHEFIMEQMVEAGERVHYGPDFTFDPAMSLKYSYKRHLASHSLVSAYAAVLAPTFQPPYYDKQTAQWVLK